MNNTGILDPEGLNPNPLTGEKYSDAYKKLAKIWSKYPAYHNPEKTINLITQSQVVLVIGNTGSGKTVLTPKYALHSLNYEGKIAITLPKQIVTLSAAEFAAKTLDVKLGEQVSYKYKGSDEKYYNKNAKLLYATDGTIVARLLSNPLIPDFDCIIVDEVHERKVQTDLLIYLLRNSIRLRPSLKVILMSATVDETLYKNYFSDFKFEVVNIGPTTNHPIEKIFLKSPISTTDYVKAGMNIIQQIIKLDDKDENKDILFFVKSGNEASEVCKMIDQIPEVRAEIYCAELYSGMSKEKEELAIDKSKYKETGKTRKVVISTPVGESSLTIDGLKYVIDSGYELFGSYDPEYRARRLDTQMITAAQSRQRMGRVGRSAPGIFYALYTEMRYNSLQAYPEPSIRTSNICGELLKLLSMPLIQTPAKLIEVLSQFIECPRESYIRSALDQLVRLNMTTLDKITPLGMIVADFGGVEPPNALSILAGKLCSCGYEIMKIISMIDATKHNMNNLFISATDIIKGKNKNDSNYKEKIYDMNKKITSAKNKFIHKYGDHLTLLKVFEKYNEYAEKNPNKVRNWCYDNFIKSDIMDKATKHFKKLKQNVQRIQKSEIDSTGFKLEQITQDMEIDKRIMYCFLIGLKLNIANMSKTGSDNYTIKNVPSSKIRISPSSVLSNTSPKHVFYDELFIMGNVLPVNPESTKTISIIEKIEINIVSKIPKVLTTFFI